MSTTNSTTGETNKCKRCVEGLPMVPLISNGDGTWTYDIDCNQLINSLDVTETIGGKSSSLKAGGASAICSDIGKYAVDQWNQTYTDPLYPGDPPAQGYKMCLEFGVSMCYQLETDANGQTSITGKDGLFSSTINGYSC
jgi:hypothetical protein